MSKRLKSCKLLLQYKSFINDNPSYPVAFHLVHIQDTIQKA